MHIKSAFFSSYIHIVVSVGQFCCVAFGTCVWMIPIQRQIIRMNIFLFRSLLQRVSPMNISFWCIRNTSNCLLGKCQK